MKIKLIKKLSAIALSLLMGVSIVGCTKSNEEAVTTQTAGSGVAAQNSSEDSLSSIISTGEGSALDTSELFSNRDLEQSADLTGATSIQLESGKDVNINTEGVYVLKGDVVNTTVIVEASEEAKIQIVLDGVSIKNEDSPAIYVKSGDKVFVTSTDSDNKLEVSGSYVADGDTNLDAVIFSKADITFNGTGTLEVISSEGNGITSKDDLKVTGGTYNINSSLDGMEANDGLLIYNGNFTIASGKDAIHSENADDTSLGYIYIKNGTFNIKAADDAIQGNSIVQIDGGNITIETSTEGIEGTYIQINGGEITLYAKDDGINATAKSDYDVAIEVNGGTINVSMGSGDTDAFDANGNIYINDGTISIEATSAFDSDGTAELNGGNVKVNGEKITQITQSQMGGKIKRK